MSIPDICNGIFESGGAWFTWRNAYQLYLDKEIKGAYWPAWFFFAAWGIWNLFYYPNLHQWVSFSGGAILVIGNIWWCVLAIKYRNRA